MTNAERQARYKQRLKQAVSHRDRFLQWCRDTREMSERELANYESGSVRTREKIGNGDWVDTTEANAKYCREVIAEMTKFIEAADKEQ